MRHSARQLRVEHVMQRVDALSDPMNPHGVHDRDSYVGICVRAVVFLDAQEGFPFLQMVMLVVIPAILKQEELSELSVQ